MMTHFFGIMCEKLNVNVGTTALGHPNGTSGAALLQWLCKIAA
jgi:acetyl-CoA acetyltransferase